MSCEAPKSVENWQKHITGAATLLQLWKSNKNMTTTSIQLFTQLRVEVVYLSHNTYCSHAIALRISQMANCLRTQTRVPAMVRRLSKLVGTYRSEENIQAESLSELMTEVCDLVADVRGNGIPNLVKVVQRAEDIDARIHAWSLNLSSRWGYTTHSYSASSRSRLYHNTCGGSYHLYPGIWACNIWSYYRTGRILLNLLLRDRLGPLVDNEAEWTSAYDEAKANITKLSIDILLSVPYSMSLQFSSTEVVGSNLLPGGYLGGYSILWPLYVAASVSAPGSSHRDWAIGCLEYIGHRMGIGQALLMARVVSSEIPHELLSIYDYCQSYRPNL